MSASEFAADIFQNDYWPDGAGVAASAAEIIIVDCSTSMGEPAEKLSLAREAAAIAIDSIRDGVAFVVLRGTGRASPVYPRRGPMAIADHETRQAAQRSVRRLSAFGSTAMSRWLWLARELFQTRDDELRHAILLTDGHNGDHRGQLEAELARCEGVFRCDCRGVGAEWQPEDLRKISTALMGTVDSVPDPASMSADFRAMMRAPAREAGARR